VSEERCETCRFWQFEHKFESDGDYSIGRCRRRAPELSQHGLATHPATVNLHWCGDYQPKTPEACTPMTFGPH
jgi:hypothetical protein